MSLSGQQETKAEKWQRRIAHEFVHLQLALLGLSILVQLSIAMFTPLLLVEGASSLQVFTAFIYPIAFFTVTYSLSRYTFKNGMYTRTMQIMAATFIIGVCIVAYAQIEKHVQQSSLHTPPTTVMSH